MPVWSREQWDALWDDYPHRQEFAGVPRGFVLEVDGAIVGSISSVLAKYSLAGRELRACAAGNAAVDPAHRAGSVRLFGEQLLQPGIDLYLNGSASAVTSKIMDTLKVPRIPQADYDVSLLWALRGTGVAKAGLTRRGVPLASLLAWPVGVGMQLVSTVKIRSGARARYPVRVVDSPAPDFDDLWERIRARTSTLVAFRDHLTLRWRYGKMIAAGNATILAVHRDGVLAGYTALVRKGHPKLGVDSYVVHDLQCVDDDEALTTSLLAAAWKHARAASLDLLEWTGFAGTKRAIAERSSTLRYRLGVWQAFYYTRDAALKPQLTESARWDFCGYDSD
ncbi:MAG: hypothetical protein ABMA00_20935 [Gemmatimonas sp.]